MYIQQFSANKPCDPDKLEVGHFSVLRSVMRDAELLKAALAALEIPVQINGDVRGSNGQRYRADIVGVLEGKFDIGFIRAEDGSFNLVVDLWGLSHRYDQCALISGINQQYRALKQQAEAAGL